MRTVSSVEAQNRFGELLDNAQREPVTITRRGRPVAFILSPEDMKDLLAVRHKREQIVSDFEAFFAKSDARRKADAANLTDDDVKRMVDELR
ncbi:type II toxin-antitoxin system Phd/YefM family antitoxin [Aromatoleum aromaticum]|nr:type II toxin-antitoxin system Phd/YefM family antitoxin [Aromatoleum aromaticum]NMG56006.1 type II toxin-antitoxin system prevent-host-death family antitoxin [Aromatoleum aromaticum]